jgi:uncharacterized protein (DUF433 family)
MPKLITEDVNGEKYEYTPLGDHVVKAKGVCGGRPTFKYTRIEVKGAVSRYMAGESIWSIIESYGNRINKQAMTEANSIVAKTRNRRPVRKSLTA